MASSDADIWITGVGLVSSLGEGGEEHWRRLGETDAPQAVVDETSFAPYPIHPICDLDFSSQIPKRSDLRQMEPWQRIGTFAAGLALDDAGIKGNQELLDRTIILAAAGNGERDPAADEAVLAAVSGQREPEARLNEALLSMLRPTLYLAQQSQLLAGNISIVHGVTGASRTYKGEEIAGAQVVEDAVRRIRAGQGELFLVGGACNAARWDQLLILELGGRLWRGRHRSVWERLASGGSEPSSGGMIMGSLGAFVVVESRSHAERRGAEPYAAIADAHTGTAGGRDLLNAFLERSGVSDGDLPVLSGASGFARCPDKPAATLGDSLIEADLSPCRSIEGGTLRPCVRAHGTMLGHAMEAHFPAGLALAALALRNARFYPAFDTTSVEQPLAGTIDKVLVTCQGNVVGEGMALLRAVEG